MSARRSSPKKVLASDNRPCSADGGLPRGAARRPQRKMSAMKIIRNIIVVLALSAVAVATSACPEKGPAEKAGEKVDKAVDKTKDAAKDAKD